MRRCICVLWGFLGAFGVLRGEEGFPSDEIPEWEFRVLSIEVSPDDLVKLQGEEAWVAFLEGICLEKSEEIDFAWSMARRYCTLKPVVASQRADALYERIASGVDGENLCELHAEWLWVLLEERKDFKRAIPLLEGSSARYGPQGCIQLERMMQYIRMRNRKALGLE